MNEWLSLLVAHPVALASYVDYLKRCEAECERGALDLPDRDLPRLRGKRDCYRDLQAYVQNNARAIARKNGALKEA